MGTSCGSFKIKKELFQKSPQASHCVSLAKIGSHTYSDQIIDKDNGINLQAIKPGLGGESRDQLPLRHICEQQGGIPGMGVSGLLLERKRIEMASGENTKSVTTIKQATVTGCLCSSGQCE